MRKRKATPGGRRKHRKGAGKREYSTARKDELEDMPEYTVIMKNDSSRSEVRIDEVDAFGAVTVYDAHGKVARVIAREELTRPWQERPGNTWNNCIFPKRISDKEA